LVYVILSGNAAACRFERVTQQRLDTLIAALMTLFSEQTREATWDDRHNIFAVEASDCADRLLKFLFKRFMSQRIFIEVAAPEPLLAAC